MTADVESVSSIAAASEDHIHRNSTPWQAIQQQFQRWTGLDSPSAGAANASLQQRQDTGADRNRLAAWGQQALRMGATIIAGEFLEGEELERTGLAEGQLPAEALVSVVQKPYDAQQYAAQRAAAWRLAITD